MLQQDNYSSKNTFGLKHNHWSHWLMNEKELTVFTIYSRCRWWLNFIRKYLFYGLGLSRWHWCVWLSLQRWHFAIVRVRLSGSISFACVLLLAFSFTWCLPCRLCITTRFTVRFICLHLRSLRLLLLNQIQHSTWEFTNNCAYTTYQCNVPCQHLYKPVMVSLILTTKL